MSKLCHLCGADALETVAGFTELPRVTSDCRPWPAGGTLAFCHHCSTLQKPTTEQWHEECAAIYHGYALYPQAAGAEQPVFNPGGSGQARSEVLLHKLLEDGALPQTGKLLDFGCGNGAFLQAASKALPRWRFDGLELDARYREELLAIPRFEGFHQGLDCVEGGLEMISMIHALEHVAHPIELLIRLRKLLADDGLLFIEVPYYRDNPFDLLIADHCSHFTPLTLRALLERAGFEVVTATTEWVNKEISLLARPTSNAAYTALLSEQQPVTPLIKWLTEVLAWAENESSNQPIGLFGTAIAASWLYGHLGGAVEFFVDEDPGRIGRTHLGRGILSPEQVPDGKKVLLCLAPLLAQQIARRLASTGADYRLPPA